MDSSHITELTSKFSEDIAALKEALEPLVNEPLNESAGKLPVLDRAKLYTFAAYSLESILFSNLRLCGVDAKSHAIFAELGRVRQYFDKIKAAEAGQSKPTMTLDKAAVGRMIKHELAGNSSSVGQGTKRKFDADGNVIAEPAAAAQSARNIDESGPAATSLPAVAAATRSEAQDDFVSIDEPKQKKKKKSGKNRKSAS